VSEHKPSRPVSTAQIAGVLSSTLALFFVIAFVGKSLEAYRLRRWRDSVRVEIDSMVRQRDELEPQVRRRQSDAWVEEVLADLGWLGEGRGGDLYPPSRCQRHARCPVSRHAGPGCPAQSLPKSELEGLAAANLGI